MPITLAHPEPPRLIGLLGRAGAGKSTVAQYLEREHGFETLAFADPLVDMVHALFAAADVPSCYLTERALKEEPSPIGPSYRKLMQTLGTDWGRNTLGFDFWVRIAQRRHDQRLLHGESVCFADVRFPNELAFIKARGGWVVRVVRDQAQPIAPHISETVMDNHTVDAHIFNNGSFATLHDQVDRVLEGLLASRRT